MTEAGHPHSGTGTPSVDRPAIPVAEHLDRILATVQPLAPYRQPLLECLGLPAAEDVRAPMPLPGFDNSAMDGYAVSFRDVADARADRPIHLPVLGTIGAGPAAPGEVAPGTALKIMTGAPVPAGCTAVVPYEWTDRGSQEVLISRAPLEGQHIRRAGEDVQAGETLLSAGTIVTPRHVGLLAAVGQARLTVRPRPRVVVISTGSELREPGHELEPGTLYDSNSFMLAAAARAAGALAFRVGLVADDEERFTAALSDQLSRADVVVTSGGVSQGDFDIVKSALAKLGTVWFGDVAMQPGKPQGFGTLGDAYVFNLPGNPVSAYISFQAFVLPALRRLQGRTRVERPLVPARATHPITSAPGKQQFVRATYDAGLATPVGGHGSHLLGDLAAANALLVVPPEVHQVEPGDTVHVMLLDEEF